MTYFILLVAIIALDRAVKYWISSGMNPGDTIPVIQDIFHITYVQNTGAAFSMMQGQRAFLIALPIAIAVLGLVILFIKRKTWPPVLNIAVAMVCGGGIGNFIDRASIGYVVDMFDFRVFPVFNVADIFVCVGCGLILYYVIFIDGKKSKKRK
ncbi:MAG: signal peptidase II [Eubacterium sp.]|nr:signal peptidase II [Candidatus Colimonas fimequi]